MAAALSLLGEINNALNPQPRTLRGQALVETVTGEGCSHPVEPPGQKDRTEAIVWSWVPEEQWQSCESPRPSSASRFHLQRSNSFGAVGT